MYRFCDSIILLALVGSIAFTVFIIADHEMFLYSYTTVFFFLILPALLIIFLILTFKWGKDFRANVALLMSSTVVSLYLAEVLFFVASSIVVWPDERPDNFDRRSRIQVIQDLRSSGLDAYPNYVPRTHLGSGLTMGKRVVFPFGGVRNVPTVYCNELGEYLIYRSDEFGFNNPPGLWKQNIDVALIGDSFTVGACVSPDKSVASLIRNYYPNTLNLGGSGNGPLIELAVLREYLADKKPRIVLWFFFSGNDPGDLYSELEDKTLLLYLSDSRFTQKLRESASQVDAALIDFLDPLLRTNSSPWADRRRILRSIITLATLREKMGFLGLKRNLESNMAAPFRRVLVEAQKSVSGWGGNLYLVYLPSYSSVKDGRSSKSHRIVTEVTRDLNIPMLDMWPIFLAQPDPLGLFPFRRHGHYTGEGYRLVAENIIRVLIPPCKAANGQPESPGC